MSNQGFGNSESATQLAMERNHLELPHLTAFRVRLRELRALSRSSFSQSAEEREACTVHANRYWTSTLSR
jgi:hypothetical protein